MGPEVQAVFDYEKWTQHWRWLLTFTPVLSEREKRARASPEQVSWNRLWDVFFKKVGNFQTGFKCEKQISMTWETKRTISFHAVKNKEFSKRKMLKTNQKQTYNEQELRIKMPRTLHDKIFSTSMICKKVSEFPLSFLQIFKK